MTQSIYVQTPPLSLVSLSKRKSRKENDKKRLEKKNKKTMKLVVVLGWNGKYLYVPSV